MITTSPAQVILAVEVIVAGPEPTAVTAFTLGIVQVAVTVAEAFITSPALEP
jgi:hypothetical protein